MLNWFRRRAGARGTASELYGRVVAAARQPMFYRDMGVADTPEGRFELVALHLFLALEALRLRATAEQDAVSRMTIEAFVADMDDCMREMGVGDLTVSKKVKRAAAAFYERSAAYRRGLEAPANDAMREALTRWVYGEDQARQGNAAALARYVMTLWRNTRTREPSEIFTEIAPSTLSPSAGAA